MFSSNKVNYSEAVLKVIKKKSVSYFIIIIIIIFNTKELFVEVLIKLNRKSNESRISFNRMHGLLLRQKWIILPNSSRACQDKLLD